MVEKRPLRRLTLRWLPKPCPQGLGAKKFDSRPLIPAGLTFSNQLQSPFSHVQYACTFFRVCGTSILRVPCTLA
jgi:hypothetical protein